jgi:hypothetical protein
MNKLLSGESLRKLTLVRAIGLLKEKLDEVLVVVVVRGKDESEYAEPLFGPFILSRSIVGIF